MGKGKKSSAVKKRLKGRPHPSSYKRLRHKGVADKEVYLRGCMAVLGALFLILFAAWIYSLLVG